MVEVAVVDAAAEPEPKPTAIRVGELELRRDSLAPANRAPQLVGIRIPRRIHPNDGIGKEIDAVRTSTLRTLTGKSSVPRTQRPHLFPYPPGQPGDRCLTIIRKLIEDRDARKVGRHETRIRPQLPRNENKRTI